MTSDCNFSVPTNLRSEALSPTSIRFAWDRGLDNAWFCVDTALSENHLLNLTGTYRWHGCGTTGTTITASGLACGTKYFWRVFAQGARANGHSAVAEVTTQPCPFSPPHALHTHDITQTSVRFDWERGGDNHWFCVDTGKDPQDILRFSGTWKNQGCGTEFTELDVTGLDCGTIYYWRVYAVGTFVSGYSVIERFSTSACPATVSQ
jgi:hypothetical protein